MAKTTEPKVRKNPDYTASAKSLTNPPAIGDKLVELVRAERLAMIAYDALKEVQLVKEACAADNAVGTIRNELGDMVRRSGGFQDVQLGLYALEQLSVRKSWTPNKLEPILGPKLSRMVVVQSVDTKALNGLIKGGFVDQEAVDEVADKAIRTTMVIDCNRYINHLLDLEARDKKEREILAGNFESYFRA